MKRYIFLFLITMFFTSLPIMAQEVLQASISMQDRLPAEFFGTWKVVSVQTFCSNPLLSAPFSVDEWNLSRANNVITLTNPQSGASASVKIDEVVKNKVTFTRTSASEKEFVTETPTIIINGENFIGTDTIIVKNYKNGKHVSTDTWTYSVNAKKVSGVAMQQIMQR